jgi:hypothetical protein
VTVLAGLAVLAPLVPLADWVVRSRPDAVAAGSTPRVTGVDGPVVPAVGQQAQTSAARSRVLALGVLESGEVRYGLLRGDGPQLAERSAAAATRTLTDATGTPGPTAVLGVRLPAVEAAAVDGAGGEVDGLVARLATGAAGDVSGDLGALAIGAVLVPPADDAAAEPARSELVGRLDATGGLERITENPTGIIWRVTAPAPDVADEPAADEPAADEPAADQPVTAWARLVTPRTGAPGGAATTVTALDAGPLSVRTTIPAGADGRAVVLAERADAGWRAWLDGRPVAAADAGWRQAFAVGADGGRLVVAYAPPARMAWWVVQSVVLGLTVLLALPVRRRRGGPR